MEKRNVTAQISIKQLKQRQISEEYLKIQENTEYLTQLVRYNPKIQKNIAKFINFKHVNFRSIYQLIVQISYLLYICFLRKISLLVSNEYYYFSHRKSDASQDIYVEYILEIDFNRLSQQQQEYLSRRMQFIDLKSADYKFGEFLCQFINKIRRIFQPLLQQNRNGSETQYTRQIQGLIFIIDIFVAPQILKLPPKAIILSFEESQLFRQYSLLVKCLNNSIFSAVKFNPKNKVIMKQLVESDLKLYKKMFIEKNNKRIIFQSIEEGLKILIKFDLIIIEQSIDEIGKTQNVRPNLIYRVGKVGGVNGQEQYRAKIYVRQKNLKVFSFSTLDQIYKKIRNHEYEESEEVSKNNKKEGQKTTKNEYQILYLFSQNLVILSYITNIQLSIDNTDLLMYHCNAFTYNYNYITFTFTQKNSPKTFKKNKYLTIKITFSVDFTSNFFFKILLYLNLLMTYSKVLEPELKKNISNLDDYFSRNQTLLRICDQMKRLFIDKIKKNYDIFVQKIKE